MLGSLGTGFTMVLMYHFGSTTRSDVKNSIIAAMTGRVKT